MKKYLLAGLVGCVLALAITLAVGDEKPTMLKRFNPDAQELLVKCGWGDKLIHPISDAMLTMFAANMMPVEVFERYFYAFDSTYMELTKCLVMEKVLQDMFPQKQ